MADEGKSSCVNSCNTTLTVTQSELPYPLLSDRKRVLIKALTGSASNTSRSHFIFEKGGKLLDKKMPVKPKDRSVLKLKR